MRAKDMLLKEIDGLSPSEVLLMHEHLMRIRKESKAKRVAVKSYPVEEVRKALADIPGQLSETITSMREERS